MHLSGAVYAETFIKDADADLLCVDPKTMSFFKPKANTLSMPPQPVCGEGNVRAESAFKDQKLYDALIDSFSMRSFVPVQASAVTTSSSPPLAASTASKNPTLPIGSTRSPPEPLPKTKQYLEIMETPVFTDVINISSRIGWPTTAVDPALNRTGDATGTTREDLSKLRDTLLAAGLRDEVATDRKELDDALDERNRIENCGQPCARAACSVKIRFLYQVLRAFPPQQVFAQDPPRLRGRLCGPTRRRHQLRAAGRRLHGYVRVPPPRLPA